MQKNIFFYQSYDVIQTFYLTIMSQKNIFNFLKN